MSNRLVTTTTQKMVIDAFKRRQYPLPTGDDIAFFGIRSSHRLSNNFDDLIGYIRRTPDGGWETKMCTGTTDPGRDYLVKPLNPKGAAAMVEGHYSNLWSRGLHRRVRQAFVQTGRVRVYRDNDKDTIIDMGADTIEDGFFGINLHDAYSKDMSRNVGKWSAGCQVLQRSSELDLMTALADRHKSQKRFSYTLFNECDVLPSAI